MKPSHLTFAQAIASGTPKGEAYLLAHPKVKPRTAQANATRLLKHPDVKAFLARVEAEAESLALESTVLTVTEKRQFLARIVRTPLSEDMPADLIKSLARTEGELSSSTRIEKLDPLRAIQIDNDLAGEGAGAQTLRELTEALANISQNKSPIPTGKL
jgi:phage terminase small subunit